MENSKLVRVLKAMKEEDLKVLEKFIASPFFNESKILVEFYAYLRKIAPTWESGKLEKEKIWKKLFPKEPYNDVRFRRFTSNLFQLVEKFIVHHSSMDDSQRYSNRTQFYYKNYLLKECKDTLKEWEETHLISAERSEHYYKLLQEIEMYKAVLSFDNNAQQIKTDFLSGFLRATDVHFIVVQLKWHCVTAGQTQNIKCEYISPFLEKILEQIEQNWELRAIPVIHIYYLIYQMIKQPEQLSSYEMLTAYMKEYPRYLTSDEWAYVASYMRNYCVLQTHKGNTHFIQKIHDLHIFQLEKGLIFSFNVLPAPIFRNIVFYALLLKEYDWVRNFIPTYEDYLPEEERHSLVHFAFVCLSFEEKEYNKCTHHLNLMEKSVDRFLEVQARILRLKIYYELQEFEMLLTMVETLKVFIFREQTFSEYYKMRYKNFTNFLLRMCSFSDFDAPKWSRLHKDLGELNHSEIIQREWLDAKIQERIKKH